MRHIVSISLLTASLSLVACSKSKTENKDNPSPAPTAAKPTEPASAPAPAPAAAAPTAEDKAMDEAAAARLEGDDKCASGDRHDCDGDGVRFEDDGNDNDPTIKAKTAGAPFSVKMGSKTKTFKEGCLMNMSPWVVMVPSSAKAKTCDVDGEDDFAMSLELATCADMSKACAIPQVGESMDATLSVTGGKDSKTKVTVVRHEKPYVVVAIAADAKGENGGEFRVLVEPTNPVVDAKSW